MTPSFRPSMPSHASTTALVRIGSLLCGMIALPSLSCVAIHECRNANVWRIRLFAGSPATMPS
jgi:hypothetical protein